MDTFTAAFAKRSDAQLVRILTHERDQYAPEAIAAAEAELDRRGLGLEDLTIVRAELAAERDIAVEKAALPLAAAWKAIAFLVPGVPLLLMAAVLKVDGYERKYRELKRWTLYGLGFYLVLFTLIAVFA